MNQGLLCYDETMEITSLSNPLIKDTAKLLQKKHRDRLGLFLVEGEHMVEEALAHKCVERIFVRNDCREKYSYENMIFVTPEIMKKLTETVSGNTLAAVCHMPKETGKTGNRVLLLDDVQDPGNLGTLLRSAVSFGFFDIICNTNTADVYNGKVLRSTQGAIFQLNIKRGDLKEEIRELKKEGYSVYGTALKDAVNLQSTKAEEKLAVILGNEGQGIKKELLLMSDKNLFIEMNGFESLNVAVAGGILMYHFRKEEKTE